MFACLFALWTTLALAVESPVRVEVAAALGSPGAEVPIGVQLLIPAGHHVYADMLAIDVVDPAGLSFGPLVEPPGKLQADPANPSKQREVYEGEVTVQLPAKIPGSATGEYVVQLLVSHQACREGLCYPAREDRLQARVGVAGVGAVPGIGTASAQEPAQDPAEEVAVVFSAKPGPAGTATVHVDLQGEWHLNKMFMSATLVDPPGYTLGEPQLPAGEKTGSEADGTAREDFVHDFDMVVPVSGPEGAATLTIDVGYQACKGVSLCRMPTTEAVKVPVSIGVGGSAVPVATVAAGMGALPAAAAPAGDDAFAAAAAQGTFALLLFCFLGGVAVSFTPCVLPMVPITLGIIGARGNTSRVEAVLLSAAYVLGQALVYTSLGVMAGVTGALFGSWLQIPWVLGGIGLLFFVLGLSMFGFFDLQVPGFIQSKISGYDQRGGFVVAFVFGLIGAVLAGPCSGPVVLGILGVIATGGGEAGSNGALAMGAALMFAFSLGMGMIFLVTGAASGWVPKRGPYMVLVKKSFGVVMWLGAIYYAAPLFSTAATALLTAAVLIVTGVFAWPDADDGEGFYAQRTRQVYTLGGVVVGVYLLLGTLVSEGFILPPLRLSSANSATEAPGIKWLSTEAEGLAAAEASGKPLMIDFTAEWCAACHELEKYTYTDPGVIALAGNFVPVMIDCTERANPVVKAVQEKYGVKGLPTVVFVKADGTVLGTTVEFIEAPAFKQRMEQALVAAG